MGAQQTWEWAVRFPDKVRRAAPIAGTAQNTPHDFLYTHTLNEAIRSDPGWNGGEYRSHEEVLDGPPATRTSGASWASRPSSGSRRSGGHSSSTRRTHPGICSSPGDDEGGACLDLLDPFGNTLRIDERVETRVAR